MINSLLQNCALYTSFGQKMEFKSKLIFLFLISFSNSIKHPNISKNSDLCYKSLMQDVVHNCYCEPFKDGFLDNKHSYLWQKVSNFIFPYNYNVENQSHLRVIQIT